MPNKHDRRILLNYGELGPELETSRYQACIYTEPWTFDLLPIVFALFFFFIILIILMSL